MPNFPNILNSFPAIFRPPIIRTLFMMLCILSWVFLFGSDISAQITQDLQFIPLDKEELLRDQKIFQEKKIMQQEIFRQEMERIRVKTKILMKEISEAMKGELLKIRGELEKLQNETNRVNQEIVVNLDNVNDDFLESREDIRRNLESMQKEAKSLKKEIALIMESERDIWKGETENFQDSLLQAKGQVAAAQSEYTLERNISDYKNVTERKANTKPSQKSPFDKNIDSSRDKSTGDLDEEVQNTKSELESFKGESATNPSQKNENTLGKEEGKETAKLTLKEEKQKLLDFGNKIKILKKRVKTKSGSASKELIELGNKYLEAQRFIDSRDDLAKLTLLEFANQKDLYLGSYEQAAWAFKIALSFNRNKGETHLTIGKIYDEINDGENAIMYARLAHLVFRHKNNKVKSQEAQSFIETLEKKYGDKT